MIVPRVFCCVIRRQEEVYLGTRDDLSARGLGPFHDAFQVWQPEAHSYEPVTDVVALHAIVVGELDAEVLPPVWRQHETTTTTTTTIRQHMNNMKKERTPKRTNCEMDDETGESVLANNKKEAINHLPIPWVPQRTTCCEKASPHGECAHACGGVLFGGSLA